MHYGRKDVTQPDLAVRIKMDIISSVTVGLIFLYDRLALVLCRESLPFPPPDGHKHLVRAIMTMLRHRQVPHAHSTSIAPQPGQLPLVLAV
jgi:hypothetical protein